MALPKKEGDTSQMDPSKQSSEPPTATLCGYLHKLSGPLKVWRSLWFTYEEEQCILVYYKTAQDANPLGCIDLSNAILDDLPHAEDGTFFIQTPERTFTLKKNTDAFQNLPVKCTKSVILDLGTWSLKAGFAGDPRPCCEVPSLVNIEPRRRVYKMGFVGKVTVEDPKVNPLHKGVVTDWDALEKLLRHVFDTELHVPIEEHAILLSDPPLSPTSNRERFAEFMFETLGTPAMHITQQSVLSVYSYGKTTGLVVDCGHGSSHVIPVYNGYQLPGETGRVDHGGQSLNPYLTNLFQNTSQTVSGSCRFDDKLLDDIKRKSCYVPVDANTDRSPGHVEYSLSDGTTLTSSLDEEKYLCPEALFQPSLMGSVEPGLPTLIMNSVNRCDIQLKRDLLQNILVCGGSTMFRGFPERLQWEMDHLVPMSSATVVAVPERQNTVWLGGSILASLD